MTERASFFRGFPWCLPWLPGGQGGLTFEEHQEAEGEEGGNGPESGMQNRVVVQQRSVIRGRVVALESSRESSR